MLSRIAKVSVARSISASSSRAIATSTRCTGVAEWKAANDIYFGKERDLVNFPHPVQPVTCPPTRLGFIPSSWFDAFYEKTGVTGPYVLGVGGIATLFSKELWLIDHGFSDFLAFWLAIWFINYKWGSKIGAYLDQEASAYREARWDKPYEALTTGAKENVVKLEALIEETKGQKDLFEVKRENVGLQLEAEYRGRLAEVHREVKKRLDYQVDREAKERSFEQTHMANWIVDGVMKGITPQQEKDSIAKCIADLKEMAAKQNAATA